MSLKENFKFFNNFTQTILFDGMTVLLLAYSTSIIYKLLPDLEHKDIYLYIIYFVDICAILIFISRLVSHTYIELKIIFTKENKKDKNTEIIYFNNQREAEKDIEKNIDESKNISIFTMRGQSFILADRSFGNLPEKSNKSIKLCISSPSNENIGNRAKEFKNTTTNTYINDLENDLLKIKIITEKNNRLECRLHNQPAIFRIIILDSCVYFSFFEPNNSGSQLPIYKMDKTTCTYDGFKRFFDVNWEKSAVLK